jgi:cysteinyl-tRNA synthetase
MGIKIYNTLTRKKEELVTLEPNKVRMYVCGVTVYNKAHVGHAMSALVFDMIRRYLAYRGYEVRHVTNFTDVDDKIINRANLLGVDPFQLAEGYIVEFQQQLQALNILPATVNPRATREMDTIIRMIEGLVEKGFAYPAGGDVYFRVQKDPHYGKLSGRRVEDMKAGARIEVGELKEDPLDFALWKAAKPGEPAWDSQWGKGRPGWHIECSAMIRTHLGDSIDIHGGGVDLTFPHHENEIAQCEAATGKPYVKYWLHNGFLEMGGQKMSKSLGNILKAKDALGEYRPEVLRYFFLSAGYRSGLNYDREGLEASRKGWEEFHQTFARVEEALAAPSAGTEEPKELRALVETVESKFREAMDDDFNTPKALGVLFELSRECRRTASAGAVSEPAKPLLTAAAGYLKKLGGLLGVVREEAKTAVPSEVEDLARKRVEAKATKNWAEADRLRGEITARGYILEDLKTGGFRLFPKS